MRRANKLENLDDILAFIKKKTMHCLYLGTRTLHQLDIGWNLNKSRETIVTMIDCWLSLRITVTHLTMNNFQSNLSVPGI